jgi:hypothetical protein
MRPASPQTHDPDSYVDPGVVPAVLRVFFPLNLPQFRLPPGFELFSLLSLSHFISSSASHELGKCLFQNLISRFRDGSAIDFCPFFQTIFKFLKGQPNATELLNRSTVTIRSRAVK